LNPDIQNSKKVLELLNNRYLSVSIDDFLNQPEVVEKLEDDMERAYKAISRLENKYQNDEDLYDQVSDLMTDVLKMQNQLSSFVVAVKR
jgi:hypothetical protein